MTDDIETTYWDACAWRCPCEECEGTLELVDDRDEPRKRPGVVEPVVQCYKCATVFDVEFSARGVTDD